MMDALYQMDASLLTGKAEMLRFYGENCVTLGKDISLYAGRKSARTGAGFNGEGALVVRSRISMWNRQRRGGQHPGMYGYV